MISLTGAFIFSDLDQSRLSVKPEGLGLRVIPFGEKKALQRPSEMDFRLRYAFTVSPVPAYEILQKILAKNNLKPEFVQFYPEGVRNLRSTLIDYYKNNSTVDLNLLLAISDESMKLTIDQNGKRATLLTKGDADPETVLATCWILAILEDLGDGTRIETLDFCYPSFEVVSIDLIESQATKRITIAKRDSYPLHNGYSDFEVQTSPFPKILSTPALTTAVSFLSDGDPKLGEKAIILITKGIPLRDMADYLDLINKFRNTPPEDLR